MSRGKLETSVTIRSSVLIWAAELSSMVAVCGWERWHYWPTVHLSDNVGLTWRLKGQGPHLIDEHDWENGLVEKLSYAAEEKKKERERRGGQRGHLAKHVAKTGTECGNSKVGESSTKFDLREAFDSLQNDIELSTLAGTYGNSCGLKKGEIKLF